MTNRKSTKRALLGSVMAMVLCLAMLVGATFAWFTDTASTGVNKIQAGKLDVALEMKDAAGQWVSAEGKTLDFVKAAAGEQVLWEPGCTYTPPELRDQMNIQEAEEFKTSKFFCKTDFDMASIQKEESEYIPLPKFYTFKSKDARERILYANFIQVNKDVKNMINEIFRKKRAI